MAFRQIEFRSAIQIALAGENGTDARFVGLNTFANRALAWRIALYVRSLGYTRLFIHETGVDVDRWSKIQA